MTAPFDELIAQLRKRYPDADIRVDAPRNPDGVWWGNLTVGPHHAEIEWRSGRGFGVSVNSEALYGEGSDEIYSTTASALKRSQELVDSGGKTEASSELFLRALRQARKISQAELARSMRVKQASISKLERRADFRLSTLQGIVSSLGGLLEVRALFPDGRVQIIQYTGKLRRGRKGKGQRSKRPRSIAAA